MLRVLRIMAGHPVSMAITVLSIRTGKRMVVPCLRSRSKAVSTSCSTHSFSSVCYRKSVFKSRTIMQEDVQAWVDFQHPATRRDALVEMIEGLTAEMRPETAWLRRRVRGPMPQT